VFALALPVRAALAAAPEADDAPVRLVLHYLDALRAQRYDVAFALLDDDERRYLRSASNFRSGFTVDGYALLDVHVSGRRVRGAAQIVLVRERVAFDDPAHDVRVTTSLTVPYAVSGSGAAARVTDAGRPWFAYASEASAVAAGVRITVHSVAYFSRSIRVVVTIENDGDRFVTVLPYGRSVLRAGDAVYDPLETNDWSLTDRQFFLGVRLAPRSRSTGVLAFVTPRSADPQRPLTLTIGPVMHDGAATPTSIDVAGIAPRE
jgi:hypothetical protein